MSCKGKDSLKGLNHRHSAKMGNSCWTYIGNNILSCDPSAIVKLFAIRGKKSSECSAIFILYE